MRNRIWLEMLALIVAAVIGGLSYQAAAQERDASYPPTRVWAIGRIDIVDTAGVCLYVIDKFADEAAIAAVPKTALPPGTGCQ